jgi:hypothetical protein
MKTQQKPRKKGLDMDADTDNNNDNKQRGGRPALVPGEATVTVTVRMQESLLGRLREIADDNDTTVSGLVRGEAERLVMR